MDVVVDGDVAWVAGLSVGKHDGAESYTRGMIVPIDIHTGAVVGPVIIAPEDGSWKHSMFFGLALDAEGLVTTGAGCEAACGGVQRIETSRYTPAGVRTWHQPEARPRVRTGAMSWSTRRAGPSSPGRASRAVCSGATPSPG
jgi:hypothetical protein